MAILVPVCELFWRGCRVTILKQPSSMKQQKHSYIVYVRSTCSSSYNNRIWGHGAKMNYGLTNMVEVRSHIAVNMEGILSAHSPRGTIQERLQNEITYSNWRHNHHQKNYIVNMIRNHLYWRGMFCCCFFLKRSSWKTKHAFSAALSCSHFEIEEQSYTHLLSGHPEAVSCRFLYF